MGHLEHPIRGHVRSVRTIRLGDVLTADANSSDTTLYLEDVEDFDEKGGFVSIEADDGTTEIAEYDTVDFDANTLDIPLGIVNSYSSGDAVLIYTGDDNHPYVTERRAQVEVDDSDDDDEVLDVRIPHALYLYLPEGIRDRLN